MTEEKTVQVSVVEIEGILKDMVDHGYYYPNENLMTMAFWLGYDLDDSTQRDDFDEYMEKL